jgi:hypothetical protein
MDREHALHRFRLGLRPRCVSAPSDNSCGSDVTPVKVSHDGPDKTAPREHNFLFVCTKFHSLLNRDLEGSLNNFLVFHCIVRNFTPESSLLSVMEHFPSIAILLFWGSASIWPGILPARLLIFSAHIVFNVAIPALLLC